MEIEWQIDEFKSPTSLDTHSKISSRYRLRRRGNHLYVHPSVCLSPPAQLWVEVVVVMEEESWPPGARSPWDLTGRKSGAECWSLL